MNNNECVTNIAMHLVKGGVVQNALVWMKMKCPIPICVELGWDGPGSFKV